MELQPNSGQQHDIGEECQWRFSVYGVPKPEVLNQTNNSLDNEPLQVMLFGQKDVLDDTVAPSSTKMNEEAVERWERWRSEVAFLPFLFKIVAYLDLIFILFNFHFAGHYKNEG